MTSTTPTIRLEPIESIAQMKALEKLQQEVWGWNDLDTTPLMNFIILKEIGGVLIGAFDGDRVIGFAFGFVGQDEGRTVFHSHMLGVHPAYRQHGVGLRLKLAQRTMAVEQGFDHMTWTFDPLQSTNAHLNFRKLGVVANRYKVNFYGDQSSSPLYRYIGTDRLWVEWFLRSKRVRDRLQQEETAVDSADRVERLIAVDREGLPVERSVTDLHEELLAIEIPAQIGLLQQQNHGSAQAWRNATRDAFIEAFAAGFVVEDFFRIDRNGRQVGCYLLVRGSVSDLG